MKELNVKVDRENLVKISLTMWEILQNFDYWGDWHLLRRMKHDVDHMIIAPKVWKKYQGHAFLSNICTAKNATSLESFFMKIYHIMQLSWLMSLAITWEWSMTMWPAKATVRPLYYTWTYYCRYGLQQLQLPLLRGDCLIHKP